MLQIQKYSNIIKKKKKQSNKHEENQKKSRISKDNQNRGFLWMKIPYLD